MVRPKYKMIRNLDSSWHKWDWLWEVPLTFEEDLTWCTHGYMTPNQLIQFSNVPSFQNQTHMSQICKWTKWPQFPTGKDLSRLKGCKSLQTKSMLPTQPTIRETVWWQIPSWLAGQINLMVVQLTFKFIKNNEYTRKSYPIPGLYEII